MSNQDQHPNPSQPLEDDELSIIDLWNIVWKRKIWWLTLGPLAGVVGIYIALTSTEIFRAEVLLAPAQSEEGSGGALSALAGQFGGLASMAGINLPGGGSTTTAIATLESRKFIHEFIQEKNLIPVLFKEELNKIESEEERPTLWDAFRKFDESILEVSEDQKTGLITLSIEWKDPELAAEWAAELTSRINQHLRDKAQAETEKNLSYLVKQAEETQLIEIQKSLGELIKQQTQNAMLASVTEEYAFKIIDPAIVPEERVRPKRALIVVSSGLLGGFLGIFICFILHFVETAKRGQIL